MFRPFQILRPCTGERTQSRLGCRIDAESRDTFDRNHRAIDYNGSAGRHQRQRLLHGEERPLNVDTKILVEVFFGHLFKWNKSAAASVGEQNVEPPFLLFDRREQGVEFGEVGNITANGHDVAANLLHGCVKLGLTSPSDENVSAFRDESLCGREPEPAAPAGDKRNLSCEFL
jgi:hypothetical protein